MSEFLTAGSAQAGEVLARAFEDFAPFLVEVRFPRMGTSSDWFLCQEQEELDPILERLAPGVEIYLSSVWDLVNPKGEIRLRKE